MSEPKVEFDLQNAPQEILEQFDQFRRWFEFREDVKTPSMQTFEGVLAPGSELNLYVPGVVFGYSGMTQYTGGYWAPITFSTTAQIGRCYFALELDNENGNFLKLATNVANSIATGYRVTVMYRDA